MGFVFSIRRRNGIRALAKPSICKLSYAYSGPAMFRARHSEWSKEWLLLRVIII